MFKLKSPAYCSSASATLVSQNMFCCRNRFVLLIFSLLCTIIILTQQAVALTIPPTSQRTTGSLPSFPSALSSSSSESLVMILPQVNASKGKMLSVLEEETSFNNNNDNVALLEDVLTPGQQVINAVPDKERGDFIMYELAIALKESEELEDEERWLRNLEDVEEFYGKKLTTLENVPIYENFSQDLLQWIEQKFNLTHQNVYNQLRSRSQLLCTSDGVCYNSKNIGCYCCPF